LAKLEAGSYSAFAGGNASNNGTAIEQQWYPPLDHCTTTLGCIGPYEALYNALDDLIIRLQNSTTSDLAQTAIFAKLGTNASGKTYTTKGFLLYLTSNRPTFYNGFLSTYCYSALEPIADPNALCNKLPTPLIKTVEDFLTKDPTGKDADAITGTPSTPLLVFFSPQMMLGANSTGYNNLGKNLGNEGIIFHEALHGFTGQSDFTILDELGLNSLQYASCSISVRIQKKVLLLSTPKIDPTIASPCSTGD